MGVKETKILIVDDEEDILLYLATLFEDYGYTTVTAQDGENGYRVAQEVKPDLITLDIAMPEQSGIKTYRSYKRNPQLQHIPVIVITGVGEKTEGYFKKLGDCPLPEGIIDKPIDPANLLHKVERLLKED